MKRKKILALLLSASLASASLAQPIVAEEGDIQISNPEVIMPQPEKENIGEEKSESIVEESIDEAQPEESKPGESKPGESKPEESKPEESKPEESKPGESKPEQLNTETSNQLQPEQSESIVPDNHSKEDKIQSEDEKNTEKELRDTIIMVPVAADENLQASNWNAWQAIPGKSNFTDQDPVLENGVLKYRKKSFMDILVMNTDSRKLLDGEAEYIVKMSDGNNVDIGRIGFMYRATADKHAKLVYGSKTAWTIETNQKWRDITGPELLPNKWYKIKISYEGNNVKLYVNDELMIDEDGSGLDGYPDEAGHIGFREHFTPKDMEFRSIKNGAIGSIPTLDVAEYYKVLAEAKEKAESGEYSTQSRKALQEILVSLPEYYTFQEQVNQAIENLKKAMEALKPEKPMEIAILENEQMKVTISRDFPQVVSYEMKELGKTMNGQKQKLDTVRINGIDLIPEVTVNGADENRVEYSLLCQKDGIHCKMTVEIKIENDVLHWAVTEINNLNEDKNDDEKLVRSIEFPKLSIVSINSRQTTPALHGGKVITDTRSRSGDQIIQLTDHTPVMTDAYYIATIYNNELAATLYTNSDASTDDGDWNYTHAAVYMESDGSKSLGLNSVPWIHQRGNEYRIQNETIAGETELPFIRVKVVGDENGDGIVNWNDGAIAYRSIEPKRFGSEMVPDTVAIRIAMNFGSHAQNPFLTTLDNVKKVYLHTDGLGQNVLLKGYGSEGHDSGHLNYADIGRRIGGAEDMKVLLAEGHKYGAKFGIHVNASETYPESKYFEPNRLRKNGNNYSYGWNWIDQGINIDADYDLRNGRAQRFADLAKILDRGDGKNDLDYIYVDVWGNGQSGDNSSWPTMQLAKEIQKQNWAVAAEWGFAFAPAAIFQHWAADVTYGGYQNKGINSKIIRFVQNGQRDSWPSNYATYSGVALNPLLGGYNMKDFEGWQGRNGYAAYIYNLFRIDVPSKFVQHFDVMKWEDGNPVTLPGVSSWKPDVRIELKNQDLGELVIIRGNNNYTADEVGYRSRTMLLKGKEILKEAPEYSGNKDETLVEYLLPWKWNENGVKLADTDEKLYAFTNWSRPAIWQLPDDWANLEKVYLYRLTDLGRTDETEIIVNQGSITLELTDGQPYVIYKNSHPETRNVEWSNYAHLTDMGFNSRSLSHWEIHGGTEGEHDGEKIAVVDTASGTQVLEISNNKKEISLGQRLTELKPNTDYAVYVGVENRSDVKAFLRIVQDGRVVSANNVGRSLALNFVQAYAHNTNNQSFTVQEPNPYDPRMSGTSYFQNMYVFFRTGSDVNNLQLQIGRQAGEGTVYFDDIRVVETVGNPYSETEEGKVFTQDFENVPQGVYPFVISGVEGVQDNRQHLSERNEPYTQKGWHTKLLSDVIDGKWSLKVNGLISRNNMLFQTIPQNYQFLPGKTYRVSFDYLAGTDKAFDFVVGSGAYYGRRAEAIVFTDSLAGTRYNTKSEAGHYEFEFTVPADKEDYWIGIYSNRKRADLTGIKSADINFSGAKDFVLDNLKIVEKNVVTVDKSLLQEILKKAEEMIQTPGFENKYTRDSIRVLEEAVRYAKKRLDEELFTQQSVDLAVAELYQAINSLVIYQIDVTGLHNLLRNAERILADSEYAEEYKPALKEMVKKVKESLKKEHLLENEVKQWSSKLKEALDKVRISKNEAIIVPIEKKIPAQHITAIEASSEAPYDGNATKDKAVDGIIENFWHNDWQKGTTVPHWLVLKLDKPYELSKLNYVARFDRLDGHGRIKRYTVEVSENGRDWNSVITNGRMVGPVNNIRNNPIFFISPVKAKYLRFTITASTGNLGIISELEFFESTVQIQDVVPLPQAFDATELQKEIELANVERRTEGYLYGSVLKRETFETALKEAKELVVRLYEADVVQEKINQVTTALKTAREELDGKTVLENKINTLRERFIVENNKGYNHLVEKELKNLIAELPRFSPIWMEMEKNLTVYRSKVILPPYQSVPSTPSIPNTNQGNAEVTNSQSLQPKIDKKIEKPKHAYKDVPQQSWFEEAVADLTEKGLIKGTAEDRFEPETKVNRAMLPVILFRLAKAKAVALSEENQFKDVEKNSWYAKELAWAKMKDFVKGKEDGTYQPDVEISRQDFLVVLYRFMKEQGHKSDMTGANRFVDLVEVSDYAKEAIHWATEQGILKGHADGKCYPKVGITRAEMAVILSRLLEFLNK